MSEGKKCYIYKPTELKVLELEERFRVPVPEQVQVELKYS